MTHKNDGGPAFPRPLVTSEQPLHFEEWELAPQAGMTLRDWFAGMAFQGLCSSLANRAVDVSSPFDHAMFAYESYKAADAMLAKRGKT